MEPPFGPAGPTGPAPAGTAPTAGPAASTGTAGTAAPLGTAAPPGTAPSAGSADPPPPPRGPGERLLIRLLVPSPHFLDVKGQQRSGRPLALLSYLLLDHPEGTSRDELMEVLWDPTPGRDASGRMRTLLHETGTLIPPGILSTEGRRVRVDASRIDCDVVRVREGLLRNDMQVVLDLYETGAFESGIPRNARDLEEWADRLRRRLRDEVREALEELVHPSSTAGAALRVAGARRLTTLEPDQPDYWLRLLSAGVDAGDRGAAVQAADRLQTLAEEEGTERPPEVQELLRQLRERGEPEGGSGLLRLPWVGRDRELERLRQLLFRMMGEEVGVVVGVGGPTGIGKTRLLRELEGMALAREVTWVRVPAFEMESRTPLSLLPSLLRPLLTPEVRESLHPGERRALADLLPGSTEDDPGVPGAAPTLAVREAALSVVQRAAARQPVVLLIDDAHHCDPQTLEFLHRLSLQIAALPVLLILAFRENDQRTLNPFLAAVSAVILRLHPLTREDIRNALTGLGAFPQPGAGERLASLLEGASGGVPLILEEQLRRLLQDGPVRLVDGVWSTQGLEANPSGGPVLAVGSLLRTRIESFPAEDRILVAAAAVANRPSSLTELALLLESAPGALADSADRLVEGGLLTPVGGELMLSHPEAGEAALQALPEYRRQALFAQALRREVGGMGADAPRMPLLGRLRLACGAGAGLEAREFLLSAVAGLPWGEARRDEVAELLERVRQWAASPAMYARLHGEVENHAGSPEALSRRLKVVTKVRRWSGQVQLWGLRVAGLVGVAGALGVAAGFMFAGQREVVPLELFAGGGTLVLERAEGIQGLRFTGPGVGDTMQVPADAGLVETGEWKPSSRGGRVMFTCLQESGPPEVCWREGDAAMGVLSTGPGDDFPQGWSPDGAWALVMSDRDSRPPESFAYDVHVAEVASGSSWNLSGDPDVNYIARWSPDGTRIAYTKGMERSDSLVVATADGLRLGALGLGGIKRPVEWSPTGTRLALVLDNSQVVVVEAESMQVLERHPVDAGPMGTLVAWSPDGNALAVSPRGLLQASVKIIPVNRGGLIAARFPGEMAGWWADDPPPYLAEVQAVGPASVQVGEPFRVALLGRSSTGAPLRPQAVGVRNPDPQRWQLFPPDTLVALIPGTASVQVSAGGWRSAELTVEVLERPEPRLVMVEDWSGGIDSLRWHPWGDPQPEVRMDPEGRPAMWNAGDHHYPSGLVTREAFPTAHGLTVEWLQRTPLTGDYWQEVWMTLHPDGVEAFQKDGDPYRAGGEDHLHLAIPIQIGSPPEPRTSINCGREAATLDSHQAIFTNTEWHRVTVQIFPSGGCEVRVDGTPIFRTLPPGGAPWPPMLRLGLGGRTHATDVQVGEVRVWMGTR